MKKNIAVVGCGHWGKNLVRNFAELNSLKALCDPDQKLANKFADQYKVKNLSFPEINDDPDIEGVVLAVPALLHASMAIEAMNAGKNIFVEKPLAMNQDEAENMISCAKDNGVKLMVGHLLQYHPVFKTLRDLKDMGEFGNLKYIYSNRLSFGKVRTEEDVIWSFAPHDISMILCLAGQQTKSVRTVSASMLQNNLADSATIHMEFIDGIKAHISVSWLHPHKEQKLVLIGESAMVVFDDTKPWNEKLALYRYSYNESNILSRIGSSEVEYLQVPQSEPLRNECKHFIDVVNEGIVPLTDGKEGLSVLNILSAASLSQAKNKKIIMEKI